MADGFHTFLIRTQKERIIKSTSILQKNLPSLTQITPITTQKQRQNTTHSTN